MRPPQRSRTSFPQFKAPLPRDQITPAWTPYTFSNPRAPLNSISPSENRKLANLGNGLPELHAQERPDPFAGNRKQLGRMTLPIPDSEQLLPHNGARGQGGQTTTSKSSTSAQMWCDSLLPGSTRSFSPSYILGSDAAGLTPLSHGKGYTRGDDAEALPVFSDFSDHARPAADISPSHADTKVMNPNQQVPQPPSKATNDHYSKLVSQDTRKEGQTGSPFGGRVATQLPERLHRTGTPSPAEWSEGGIKGKDISRASTSNIHGRLSNMDAMRAPSLTTRDPYKAEIWEDPTAKDSAYEINSRDFDQKTSGNTKQVAANHPKVVSTRVSSNVRGRKEGHPDFTSGGARPSDRDEATSTLPYAYGKENTRKADQLTPHNGVPKKRRVSKQSEEGTSSKEKLVGSRENRSRETGSPVKLDTIVDLTADIVTPRSTLREIGGNVL
ncbi:MAG: hypothetical protein OHK93_001375 [Ramalina farinacea]|uniref:Uncharacterized protein n=1 Tax=Ramalina farinacea TaxID=258253 RepID=A0AA43QTR6_9LECA|nr:hypothetical protein [Ramalina farinacea]